MIYENIIKKIKIVKICCYLLVAAILIKVSYIQIINREDVYQKAITSWQRSFPVQADRGKIYTSNGKVLATNLTTSSLVVVPSQIEDAVDTASKLCQYLDCDEKTMVDKLRKKVSIQRISPEGRQLNEEVSLAIEKLRLPGVYLIKDTKRYYPLNNYLSHCLGFVGIDNQGLLGLELKYDEYLQGANGSINYYMDAKSHNLKMYPSTYQASTNGFNVVLTIDDRVQDVVERVLENADDTYNPDGIWALAMNPNNGEILAMSSKPDFNCNDYRSSDSSVYNQNIPIWKSYEPGSTFKVITFSSALNENLFDMDKDTYYDRGFEIVSGARIKSWKKGGHGLQTFREVLQNSSNPGFVEIGRRLGKEKLYSYVQNFGLTNKTGIDLPGESKGIMFDYDNFKELEQATVAFGQGISITPLQLVRAICACVNGGTLYKPYILKEVLDVKTNDVIFENKKEAIRQVISKETSKKVCSALESVVCLGGGRNCYIDGYRIGGKTGTAQKAVNGSYEGNGYILSFCGVAPITDPQIVLYLAMDNPKNCIQYGGTTVAPLAKKIFQEVLPAIGVEKVKSQPLRTYNFYDQKNVMVDNYVGKNKSEISIPGITIKYIGEGTKVVDQLPRAGSYIKENGTIMLMLS